MTLKQLLEYHSDPAKSAQLAGLVYVNDTDLGYKRIKKGKKIEYLDKSNKKITDNKRKTYLDSLKVPPAWKKVQIADNPLAHLLATGVDAKGRKQYLYHSHWRKIRSLLNFYRLIPFGKKLSLIRHQVKKDL